MEEIDLESSEVQRAASMIQASFRGHQSRKNVKSENKLEDDLTDIDLTDPELLNAATKIQASFRLKSKKSDCKPNLDVEIQQKIDELSMEDNADIDLNDPELNKAAVKIQSVFRGHKTRKV